VDADTGEEVENEDIVKGYKVDTDTYIEVTKEEAASCRTAIAHPLASGSRVAFPWSSASRSLLRETNPSAPSSVPRC
jgi:hypothetical protein